MRKTKYFFNPQTLNYEKVRRGFWYYFVAGMGVFSFSVVIAFIIFLLFMEFVDSPKEKMLKNENRDLKEQLMIVEKQVEGINKDLEKLVEKDNDIYRTIFEAEPVSNNLRMAGSGGVDKYVYLRKKSGGDFLAELRNNLDNLENRISVQEQSMNEIIKMAENKKKMLAAIPSIQPVANEDLKRLASGYGYRIDPFYRTRKFHSGLDFTAPVGTEIYATADGVVREVKTDIWGYGRHIEINHGYGYSSLYAHMSKFAVKRGEKVSRGQLIGYVGSTGKSTAPHLHYEIRINGQAVNPAFFFHNDLSDEDYKKLIEIASSPNQSFD
jgi:murein DD-endopeptidase MepM/ murein hydrolase activator NlpD